MQALGRVAWPRSPGLGWRQRAPGGSCANPGAGERCPGRDGAAGASLRHVASFAPSTRERTMPKAYWISAYRSVSDPDKLAAYAKLAGPAITAGGGRFLARGTAAKTYEAGVAQRTVLIEFDSVEQAVAAHDSPG